MQKELENYRKKYNLTYDKMAKLVSIPKNTLYNHCKGLRNISAAIAIKYHKTFDIPLEVLCPKVWNNLN